jgi:hypothetical protein
VIGRESHWIRRHPVLTAVLALWVALLALGFATSEENRDAAGAIVLVIVALASFAVTWAIGELVNQAVERQCRRMASNMPPLAPPSSFSETPGSSAHGWTATGPGIQAVHPHASALEKTAHVHLPAGSPRPNRFKPVTLGDILAMTPTEFEQLCVRALLVLGYDEVRRTGGAGDLAADITAKDAQGRSVVVQCKRYAPGSTVGSPVIQTFIGMKAVHHKADRGIVITTAEFSKPAIELAKQHDIVLTDGDDIVKLLNLMGTR